MSFKTSGAKIVGLSLLLIAELEYLLVFNYPIRTELRRIFGLPIYHVVLTFFTLALLIRFTSPKTFGQPRGAHFSPGWLVVHLLGYVSLSTQLVWLWNYTHTLPKLLILTAWTCIGLALLGSWLRSWLPFRHWKGFLISVSGWACWAVPLSLAAPFIAEFASSWWRGFADLTFELCDVILGLFYRDAVSQPDKLLLGTSRFVIEIQPGCSGYEGMGLISVVVGSYLWIKRNELRFPLALVSLPVAMLLAYVANVGRLVLLVIIGTNFSPEVAGRGFHSQAGWLTFTLLSLALIAYLEKSKQLARSPEAYVDTSNFRYPSVPYLAPLCGLLLGSMLSQALSPAFPLFYFLRPLLAACLLWQYRAEYRDELKRPDSTFLLTGVVVYGLWIYLVPFAPGTDPFENLEPFWAIAWIVVRCLGAVVVVPLCEELAFRGYLLRRLQGEKFELIPAHRFSWPATLGSSFFFAIFHTDLVAGFMAGIAYAWVSTRPGNLSNAILAHALTNGLIALQVLLFGHYYLW